MGDALSSLETQYIFLTNHLNDFQGACQTDAQKQSFITSYVASRKNYWDCIKKIFQNNDPQVAAAVQDMKTAQQGLEDSLKKLNQIASVLNTIDSAVKIGAKLAAMAK